MFGFKKGENREEKIDLFLDNVAWWHSSKDIDYVSGAVKGLTDELKLAGKSSDRLTEALNKISLYGVWIAGIGVFVAFANLAFEIFKYFIGK